MSEPKAPSNDKKPEQTVEIMDGDMIVREVKVDRKLDPLDALVATGRTDSVNKELAKQVPVYPETDVKVYFFKIDRAMTSPELEEEFNRRGLKPDPIAQAKVNLDDSSFGDKHPNGTLWRNHSGEFNYAFFTMCFDGKRRVALDKDDNDWQDYWYIGGVKK